MTMRWPRQQFPLHFAGDKIDYYVDGELKASSEFDMSVGKCILNAVGIAVNPRARYDVELKLMQKDERAGDYIELSSLSQSFSRNKPGCFEFIKDAKGFYRLRGKNERLTKKRRIAYIVKDGYKIVPGQGMKAVSEYEASGDWDENQIFIYDVGPVRQVRLLTNLRARKLPFGKNVMSQRLISIALSEKRATALTCMGAFRTNSIPATACPL